MDSNQAASVYVKSLVSYALQLDSEGHIKEAYIQYVRSLQSLLEVLVRDLQPDGCGELSPRLVKLGKQCMDRMTEMFSQSLVPKSSGSFASSAYPASAAVTPTSPTTPSHQATGWSADVSSSPLLHAEQQNQKLLEAYRRRKERVGGTQTEMNLSLQRKMVENVSIAKAREDALVRKLRERHQLLHTQASRQLVTSIGLSNSEKERRLLYLQVLQYEKNMTSLLEWRERISHQADNEQALTSLVKYILSQPQHPMTVLIQTCINQLHTKLKNSALESQEAQQTIIQDVRHSLEHLCTMWPVLYEDMVTPAARDVCYSCTEDVFFRDLWHPVFQIFRQANSRDETVLQAVLSRLHASPPSQLEVTAKFQLAEAVPTRYSYPYQSVVTILQSLPQQCSPLAKLGVIVEASQHVCHCVQEHYDLLGSAAPSLGAEDFLPILCFILVRLRDPSIVSECSALEEFIHEGYLLGAEGYSLASLRTAIYYLIHIDQEHS